MPSLKEHEESSLAKYGKGFTPLHRWMDELAYQQLGSKHRRFRHDPETTPQEAKTLFGEFADHACLDHIMLDKTDKKNKTRPKVMNGGDIVRPHHPYVFDYQFREIFDTKNTFVMLNTKGLKRLTEIFGLCGLNPDLIEDIIDDIVKDGFSTHVSGMLQRADPRTRIGLATEIISKLYLTNHLKYISVNDDYVPNSYKYSVLKETVKQHIKTELGDEQK